MNSLCEGGADKGAAFYYARHLFASCTHKLYAPDHPAGRPARAGVHPLRPVPGLPLPSPWLPLLEHRRGMPAD